MSLLKAFPEDVLTLAVKKYLIINWGPLAKRVRLPPLGNRDYTSSPVDIVRMGQRQTPEIALRKVVHLDRILKEIIMRHCYSSLYEKAPIHGAEDIV